MATHLEDPKTSQEKQVEMSAKKRVSDGLDSLLPRLDFGAVHQPPIWHVPTPQSRSDHCRKARVQTAIENRNNSCDPNCNGHPHGNPRTCSQLPAVKKRKHWRSRNAAHGADAHEGRSFTCPGAAVTTAATPSHAFPVATAEICKGTHADSLRTAISFALRSRAFRIL